MVHSKCFKPKIITYTLIGLDLKSIKQTFFNKRKLSFQLSKTKTPLQTYTSLHMLTMPLVAQLRPIKCSTTPSWLNLILNLRKKTISSLSTQSADKEKWLELLMPSISQFTEMIRATLLNSINLITQDSNLETKSTITVCSTSKKSTSSLSLIRLFSRLMSPQVKLSNLSFPINLPQQAPSS